MGQWMETAVAPLGVLRAPITGRALRLWMALARLHRDTFEWPAPRHLLVYMPPDTDLRTIDRARLELIQHGLLERHKNTWSLLCPEVSVDVAPAATASPDVFAEIEEEKAIAPDRMRGYMEFYAAYPKKVRPERARKAWASATVHGAKHLAGILAAIEQQAKPGGPLDMAREEGKWVPYPSTWLRDHGWKDTVRIVPPDGAPPRKRTHPSPPHASSDVCPDGHKSACPCAGCTGVVRGA